MRRATKGRAARLGAAALLLAVLATTCLNEPAGSGPGRPSPAVASAAPTAPPGSDAAALKPAAAPEKPASPAVEPEKPAAPAAKNPLAGCQQCHVDIEDKFVKSVHFEEKVACTDCHGPSKGHLADENNEVKPDEVFVRKDVDRLCERCHECERPREPKPVPRTSPEHKVCTDCHGSHDGGLAGKQAPHDPARPAAP